jgi:hypothetical protein
MSSNSSSGWPAALTRKYGDHGYIIAKPPKLRKFAEVMIAKTLTFRLNDQGYYNADFWNGKRIYARRSSG